ncbi:ABC transporter permease [Jiangella aurantiaca]|uniref:ABC transporter permease n=1 Tax=Jiangella aurantiaca TaxID=2530373 RepID=A0A4V2YSQ0_9ACTN|nr:ABC transporter permease [Jiangella aurantiaca]TDD70737.1 ABC transporter permease [Jiangella aurantiaca]
MTSSLSLADNVPASSRRGSDRMIATWVGFIAMGLVLILVVLPALLPTSPTAIDPTASLQPPSVAHPFGTDQVGRDIASRVLHGARISILVSSVTATLALLVGGLLGAAAALGPRWLDEVVMRVSDIGLAFPGMLLAIVIAASIGPSLGTTILVISILMTPPMARVARSAILNELGEDYVTAARLIGTRSPRILLRHIAPVAATPIAVYTTVIAAVAIAAEAGLSFLGAGVPPPAPSWGNIIRDGQALSQAGAWWVALFPGLAIMGAVLTLNRFSEALGRRLRST